MISAVALLAISQTAAGQIRISTPPKKWSYDGFYTQYVDFHGMPILASTNVSPQALLTLARGLEKMLSGAMAGTMESLEKEGANFSIIAEIEGQTDLPQYAHLRNDPKMDWNKRARGLGGRDVSAGEENILERKSDRYIGESIWVHEFAHTLHEQGFRKVIPGFQKELDAAFASAKQKGLWAKTYAQTNAAEYWAEGVQSYFSCNMAVKPPNGIHNEIATREQLAAYDEALFKLIDKAFGGNPWRYEGKYRRTQPSLTR